MTCLWKPIGEPDARGWKRHRCYECGLTLGLMPENHPVANCPNDPSYLNPAVMPPSEGPGTELTNILDWWGYHDNGKCGCQQFAAKMNSWGPDECERRMVEIIDHLQDAATTAGMPFTRLGAWALLRRAITLSRQAQPRQPLA